jgi:hypothetical protein
MLKVVGVTEVTYLALRRHAKVSFNPRRIKGQGEFSYAQLLALKSFALLRSHGLKIQAAAEAVEASFPAIEKFAAEGKLPSDSDYKVGVKIVTVRGRLAFAHLQAFESEGVVPVGRVEFDLRGVCALVAGPQDVQWW